MIGIGFDQENGRVEGRSGLLVLGAGGNHVDSTFLADPLGTGPTTSPGIALGGTWNQRALFSNRGTITLDEAAGVPKQINLGGELGKSGIVEGTNGSTSGAQLGPQSFQQTSVGLGVALADPLALRGSRRLQRNRLVVSGAGPDRPTS